MKTFHSGGIAAQNITQGLPRIEELFEVRKPKTEGAIAMVTGIAAVSEEEDHIKVVIEPNDKDEETQIVKFDPTAEVLVKSGDLVAAGTRLTDGSLNLQDLYKTLGARETQLYIVDEVQSVYGSQGVSIDDKHVEVIVRQMFNRVKVKTAGSTNLLPGDIVTTYKFDKENLNVAELGGEKAEAKPVLLGISKVSRMSESWLDAASFEETASVLTDSAISGSIDELIGLKENVIIGRRIPVGEEARIAEAE
jgi:DNA-directed RNA polymerase subunit beta'